MTFKGYVGHIKFDDQGNVIESKNVENPKEWAEIIKFNVKKGNEEARELGLGRMNGFAMIGKDYSLTFMKNGAYLVKTREVDWHDLFVKYTYSYTTLITGLFLTILSIIIFLIDVTPAINYIPYFNQLAPEPKFFIPILILLVGVVLLGISKSKFNYRLE